MSDAIIGTVLFVGYTCLVYFVGYTTGFSSAIDQMKKVRTRK